MSEYQLAAFLFDSLKNGGIKKFIDTDLFDEIYIDREVGNSSYISDICITANSKNKTDKTIIAIEVKISDWENGLYQAWRYKNFAEQSFLAIYRPFSKSVDTKEFVKNNIGLILFDEKGFDIVIYPETNSFSENTYGCGLREKIFGSLLNAKYICPTL